MVSFSAAAQARVKDAKYIHTHLKQSLTDNGSNNGKNVLLPTVQSTKLWRNTHILKQLFHVNWGSVRMFLD